jgi:hypothetical protein
MQVSLPLVDPAPVAPSINLFEVDPTTSSLIPAIDSNGNTVIGHVDSDMGSANFTCLAKSGTVVGLTPDVITVNIDIKPGSDPNCFNKNGHGVIPVSIIGNVSFDVNEVDVSTLNLEGLSVKVKNNETFQCAQEDWNSDGFTDLMCKFLDDEEINWEEGVESLIMTGYLNDGTPISGEDTICIVP